MLAVVWVPEIILLNQTDIQQKYNNILLVLGNLSLSTELIT